MAISLPEWVAPTPQRERFPDPLGVQPDVDDQAERFLPGITSLTERARYYSFLCWSLKASGGDSRVLARADRKLAECEFETHRDELSRRPQVAQDGEGVDTRLRCRFRGALLLRQQEGRPGRWLRTITWHLYRSSMRQLHLIERMGRDNWQLTPVGEELANFYGRSLRSNAARLPLLCERDGRKGREINLLNEIIFGTGPRAETAQFLRRHGIRDSRQALQRALRQQRRPTAGIERALWLAGVHELACLGLHSIFIHFYRTRPRFPSEYPRLPRPAREARSLSTDVDLNDALETWAYSWARLNAAWTAISALGGEELMRTRAGQVLGSLVEGGRLGCPRTVDGLRHLAATLGRAHLEAKGGDLWWTLENDQVRRLRLDVTARLSIHSYRLDAALSLMRDLT